MSKGTQTSKGVEERHSRSEAQKSTHAAEDTDTRRRLKRSAELPIDNGARDCAPGRGEHLDDDVPIVTPIVQQGEQAADAHMSKGKMEAPCLPLRTALHSSEKGTKEQTEEAQDEERHYTRACINAYKRQLNMGRNEIIAGAKYAPRLVKDALKALGNHWLAMYSSTASVCTQRTNSRLCGVRRTQEWQEDVYDQAV